jgi:hypothetical protein
MSVLAIGLSLVLYVLPMVVLDRIRYTASADPYAGFHTLTLIFVPIAHVIMNPAALIALITTLFQTSRRMLTISIIVNAMLMVMPMALFVVMRNNSDYERLWRDAFLLQTLAVPVLLIYARCIIWPRAQARAASVDRSSS